MSAKKNILFLINNLGGGGAERVLVNLVNNMDKSSYDITLRTLINQGENKKHLSDTVHYEYVFKKNFKGINYLHLLPKSYIYNKVAHGNFDVIVVYLHGVLTKIVCKAPKNQKTIAYLHANMVNSPFIRSFKSKENIAKCFNSYNAIVSVSKSVEDSFREVSGMNEKLHVIYNTFDVLAMKEKALETTENVFPDNAFLKICSVGKLNRVKGYDRLISVLAKLKQEGFGFNLVLVGEGPERATLESLITKNKLEKNVNLVGHQENPYKYISQSDLFVSSSHSEGFSSVVAESIILGIPVLTTATSGMAEILGENNEYGIIAENSEEGLYSGLRKFLSEPELLSFYTEKAKERSSFFSTEKTVKDVEHLIENLR